MSDLFLQIQACSIRLLGVQSTPLTAVALAICSTFGEGCAYHRPAEEAAAPILPARDDAELLRRTQLIFGTTGPIPGETAAPSSASREARFRTFIRQSMNQDAFYTTVLPRLFRGLAVSHSPFPFELKHQPTDGREVYWLDGDKPCPPAEIVTVRPWWNIDDPVAICKDSYAPQITTDARNGRGGLTQYCEATANDNPEPPVCRCGPNLVNCAADPEQSKRAQQATEDEVIRTIQWVVQNDRPFSQVLTMNATVRTDLGDVFYARNRFFETGRAEFTPIGQDEHRSLRERDPRFSGGVLTTPVYRFQDEAQRILVALVWSDFLCVPLMSSNVDAHQLMTLDTGALRSRDHMVLATMEGCRDCHARLENGMRAFQAFSSTREGWRLRPEDEHLTMRLYVRSSEDMRGEGPANPLWLGARLAAQPEFASCMVNRVTRYLYRGAEVPEETRARILARFRDGQNFRQLFEDAFVAFHLDREGSGDTASR